VKKISGATGTGGTKGGKQLQFGYKKTRAEREQFSNRGRAKKKTGQGKKVEGCENKRLQGKKSPQKV